MDIAQYRLCNQQIARATFEKPSEVVAWLGAVQAQDYLGSLWAIGLRMRNAVEGAVEQAIADRTIIRTWPMRGTLHFVAAADVRWMLNLLTPRIVAGPARRLHQRVGLDERIFARSRKLFAKALEGGKQLTRDAMYGLLEKANISAASQRGLHILCQLAQEGFICFGAREGKQQTFALLEEWAPSAKSRPRDEALEELARRYYTGHGPATLQDFAWWSGLRMTDAQAALDMAKPHLVQETIAGKTYWFNSSVATFRQRRPAVHLLPAFDEYTVAYKDRSAVLNPLQTSRVNSGYGIFFPAIVVDGQVVGTWKRGFKKGGLVVTPNLFGKLNERENRAFDAAARRYGEFLGASVAQ